MDDSGGHDKWVAGVLPSPRAPRRPPPATAPQADSILAQRLLRANKKRLVGRPLTVALRDATGARPALPPKLLGGVLAAGGSALVAATVIAELPVVLAAAGIGAIAAGLLALWRAKPPSAHAGFARQLRDEAAMLDVYLEQVSPNLPPLALATLAQIKEALARVLAALTAAADAAADLPAEESFFARELVARYLPDACRHYLAATEAAGGKGVLEDGRSADDSLCRQLDVLHARLEKTLAMVAAGKAQKLANHEAFIRTKESR